MVWQDFLLACAAYPEEEPHLTELEAEAREQVTRLSCHPSLVLWNGGNENLWGFIDWGWQEQLEGRTWGWRYYSEVFPRVLAELDPTRPYAQGSPYSPGHPRPRCTPTTPTTAPTTSGRCGTAWTTPPTAMPCRASAREFGFQGPPTWATLQRAVRDADGAVATKDHPTFLLHQKADDGNAKLDRGLEPHLGVPDDFADWHWATQLNQARAVAYALTHYRSWWPRTAGAVVWQLNDCWPVTSWAAVDGDERVKPLWWAMRAAFADRLLTVQRRPGPTGAGEEVVAVVNDSDDPWAGTLPCGGSGSTARCWPGCRGRHRGAPHGAPGRTGGRRAGAGRHGIRGARRRARRPSHGAHVGRGRRPRPRPGPAGRGRRRRAGWLPGRRHRAQPGQGRHPARRPARPGCRGRRRARHPAGGSLGHLPRAVGGRALEAALAGPPVLRCANDVVVRRAGLPSGA